MYLLYNLLIHVGTILILPFLVFKIITTKKYRKGLKERLGHTPLDIRQRLEGKRPIWLHAVSVGEVNASLPLIKAMKEKYPLCDLIISTVTETGNNTAKEKIKETDNIIFFPFDHPWIVKRVIGNLNPSLFITMETELWPNFLRSLHARDIPSIILNARISSRSFGKYRTVGFFMKRVLSYLSFLGVQTERDAKRIIELGAEKERVKVMGNMKFDHALMLSSREEEENIRESIGLKKNQRIMIAGSTHPGEEIKVLNMYRSLKKEFSSLFLIIAPRHLERVKEIEGLISREGFIPLRKTSLSSASIEPPLNDNHVMILDTLGELSKYYSASALILVAGSLVPHIGGHNILEAIIYKKPVFFGPYMDNFTEIARVVKETGGGIQIRSEAEFISMARELLEDEEKFNELGKRAYRVIEENQGSVSKSLEILERFI